jgi:hypothetical protein
MSSKSFSLRASTTASTKRPPAVSSGKRGTPETNIANLSCYPLAPAMPELVDRLGLNAQGVYWETFTQGGLDIVNGDYLVIGTTEYPVRAAASWPWPPGGGDRLHLVVEEIKTE